MKEKRIYYHRRTYVDISITLARSVCSFSTASAGWTSGKSTRLEDESASIQAMVTRSIKKTFTSRWVERRRVPLEHVTCGACKLLDAQSDKNNRYVIRPNYTYGACFYTSVSHFNDRISENGPRRLLGVARWIARLNQHRCLSPANTGIIDGKAAVDLLEPEDNLSICSGTCGENDRRHKLQLNDTRRMISRDPLTSLAVHWSFRFIVR